MDFEEENVRWMPAARGAALERRPGRQQEASESAFIVYALLAVHAPAFSTVWDAASKIL